MSSDGGSDNDGSTSPVRPSSSALCRPLEAAVRGAGALAREAFGKPVKTWLKDRSSPVSEIDMAVDELLRDELAAIAPDAGMLLKLQSGQWTIGRPDFGTAILHTLKRLFSDSRGGFESLDRHGVCSIMAAALHGR